MSDPRIAVIGNSFASKAQLPALRWAGGNTVVGIAGRDAEKAAATAAEWEIPHATGDWTELLALEPDLVLITTPVHLHKPMVLGALETKAAILCEKPFALDAAEAAELTAAAEGRAAWLDHQLRWSPHQRELRRWIAEGKLGAIRHATVAMCFGPPPGPPRPYRWWYDAARGGGVLGALASHLVDLVRFHLGEIASVRAELATFVPERADAEGVARKVTADEYAGLMLRLESGATVDLRTSVMLPAEHAFVVQVAGEEGTARIVGGDKLLFGKAGEELAPVEVEPPLPSYEELGIPAAGIFARCLPLYLKDVVGAVRDGSELEDAATFADGLATQRVLDAARRSAADTAGWEAADA